MAKISCSPRPRPDAEQLDRNQAIADRLDKLTGHRAETIEETIREGRLQPNRTVKPGALYAGEKRSWVPEEVAAE